MTVVKKIYQIPSLLNQLLHVLDLLQAPSATSSIISPPKSISQPCNTEHISIPIPPVRGRQTRLGIDLMPHLTPLITHGGPALLLTTHLRFMHPSLFYSRISKWQGKAAYLEGHLQLAMPCFGSVHARPMI